MVPAWGRWGDQVPSLVTSRNGSLAGGSKSGFCCSDSKGLQEFAGVDGISGHSSWCSRERLDVSFRELFCCSCCLQPLHTAGGRLDPGGSRERAGVDAKLS